MEDIDYPALYRSADQAAIGTQRSHLNTIKLYLALLIVIACLGVIGIDSKLFAIAAAILIIVSIMISLVMMTTHREGTWYRARAVAESVKTSTWRFVMRAEPYTDDDSLTIVSSRFSSRLGEILKEHKDLALHLDGSTANGDQITEEMRRIRALPWRDRAELYKSSRVDEQREWYTKKSNWNKHEGKKWLRVFVGCQVGAVVLVICRVAFPCARYLPVEVFLIGAGSALTWIQVKRYHELGAAYGLTSHEVGLVKAEIENANSESEFLQRVIDGENAFSREHTQWLARKDAV